ncbi:hypothetical protein E2I00_011246, partial [Balaenoptera physalus]
RRGGTSGDPVVAVIFAPLRFVRAPERCVRIEVTGPRRSERRACPRNTGAGLRLGDAARGIPRQARKSDRRAHVSPPLPQLPAPLYPPSPMAAAALRDPPEVNARFWSGEENVEASFEQSVSVVMSQVRTSKEPSSSQKTHPCEMCGPVLRDIFHLTEQQGTQHSQKLFKCRACAKGFYFSADTQQHQEQHMQEKPFIIGVDRASFVKSSNFHVSGEPFTCKKVAEDFLATSGHLNQQTIHTGEKPNTVTHCMETLQSRK